MFTFRKVSVPHIYIFRWFQFVFVGRKKKFIKNSKNWKRLTLNTSCLRLCKCEQKHTLTYKIHCALSVYTQTYAFDFTYYRFFSFFFAHINATYLTCLWLSLSFIHEIGMPWMEVIINTCDAEITSRNRLTMSWYEKKREITQTNIGCIKVFVL